MLYYNILSFKIFGIHMLLNTVIYIIYDTIGTGYMMSGITLNIVKNLRFWLTLISTCIIALTPFFILRILQSRLGSKTINSVQRKDFYKRLQLKKYYKFIEEINRYERSINKFRRLLKKGDFEPENLGDKKMKDLVENYKKSKRQINKLS